MGLGASLCRRRPGDFNRADYLRRHQAHIQSGGNRRAPDGGFVPLYRAFHHFDQYSDDSGRVRSDFFGRVQIRRGSRRLTRRSDFANDDDGHQTRPVFQRGGYGFRAERRRRRRSETPCFARYDSNAGRVCRYHHRLFLHRLHHLDLPTALWRFERCGADAGGDCQPSGAMGRGFPRRHPVYVLPFPPLSATMPMPSPTSNSSKAIG